MDSTSLDWASRIVIQFVITFLFLGFFGVVGNIARKKAWWNPNLGAYTSYWVMAGVVILFAAFIVVMIYSVK